LLLPGDSPSCQPNLYRDSCDSPHSGPPHKSVLGRARVEKGAGSSRASIKGCFERRNFAARVCFALKLKPKGLIRSPGGCNISYATPLRGPRNLLITTVVTENRHISSWRRKIAALDFA
jgi:hypothetical protein